MLIAVDIGNTNIVIGLFRGRVLKHEWRLATHVNRTTDEYGLTVRELIRGVDSARPTAAIMSSVVPNLTPLFVDLLEQYFGLTPQIVTHRSPLGLSIRYPKPEEIGADRLVNAAAAYEAYGGPLIIVDFGTATTFCAVSADGAYLGGVIAPGAGISADALTNKAAKLSKVEWVRPRGIIGRDTAGSMQIGMIQGHACMVDGIVALMQRELGTPGKVVATGGLAPLIVPATRCIDTVKPHLTLEGLALLAERGGASARSAKPTKKSGKTSLKRRRAGRKS